MKKTFEEPNFEIVLFTREDVVCASQHFTDPEKGKGAVTTPVVPLS